jgi:hypothetical protein
LQPAAVLAVAEALEWPHAMLFEDLREISERF